MNLRELKVLVSAMEDGDALQIPERAITEMDNDSVMSFVNHRLSCGVNCAYLRKNNTYLFVKGEIRISEVEEGVKI